MKPKVNYLTENLMWELVPCQHCKSMSIKICFVEIQRGEEEHYPTAIYCYGCKNFYFDRILRAQKLTLTTSRAARELFARIMKSKVYLDQIKTINHQPDFKRLQKMIQGGPNAITSI